MIKSLSKTKRTNLTTFGIVLAFYAIMQLLSSFGVLSFSLQGQLVPICTYVIMAISLNLTVGVLGELSLGHAGFMSIGAFTGAFFSLCTAQAIEQSWLRLPLAIIIGGAVAGIFGVLIGIPVLRLNGDYLAIVTLAFGEIIKNIFNSIYIGLDSNGVSFSLTDTLSLGLEDNGKVLWNGAQGISGTPKDATFTWGIALVLITLVLVLNFIKSRTGRAVMAIRDNRIAAESTGIPVTKYKLLAFSISAMFAGVAGALYAHNFSSLTAKKFDYNTSILILVFVVVGGLGNIRGSIIAAAMLTVLPEMLRGFENYRMLVYALVLIFMMMINQSPKAVEWRNKIFKFIKAGIVRKKDAASPEKEG